MRSLIFRQKQKVWKWLLYNRESQITAVTYSPVHYMICSWMHVMHDVRLSDSVLMGWTFLLCCSISITSTTAETLPRDGGNGGLHRAEWWSKELLGDACWSGFPHWHRKCFRMLHLMWVTLLYCDTMETLTAKRFFSPIAQSVQVPSAHL